MPDSWLPATPWDARAGGQVEELRDVGRRLRGGRALRLELEAVTEVRALSHRVLGGGAELLGPQGDVAEELVEFGAQPQVHGIAGRRDHVVADMLHTVLVGDHDFCSASTSTSASTGATAAPHLGGGPPGVGEHGEIGVVECAPHRGLRRRLGKTAVEQGELPLLFVGEVVVVLLHAGKLHPAQ